MSVATGTGAGTGAGTGTGISREELMLAGRNHSMPLEALRPDLTPAGLHYLLIHFDIPFIDAATWKLAIGGRVGKPLTLTLEELQRRPSVSLAVTLECAGNGRALLEPRPASQPWLQGAVGTASWTGTPLRALLEEAGMLDGAREVVFTGADRGIQGEIEHAYERSLSLTETARDEVLLAWAMNGQPLLPQHGYPVRLVVPGWYGMTHVKWLTAITVVDEPFAGYQQATAYHLRQSAEDPGTPVTRMQPRALLIPPGIPDFFSRTRLVARGSCRIEGRAWSGCGPIAGVEVSVDGGRTWNSATVGAALSPFAWSPWHCDWNAVPGAYEICARATDRAGNRQPLDPPWNVDGLANNAVQRVPVTVR